MDGIPMWYDEASKRLSANEGRFDWVLGWENTESTFEDVEDDDEIPF